jgi:predicted AlkP superfamily pyrophosphatase or phosphodiesterase
MARSLGRDVVRSLANGYVPGRSGEILLVPRPWNVVGRWGTAVRGPDDPRTSHATPWAYHQRVPIVLHGPGYIRSGVRSERPVDVADIAPTFAELIGMSFDAPDGSPLREALGPRRGRPAPRVVVLVAFDGGGWNVLERWPKAWPVIHRLAAEGTAYVNATIGSAPPLTVPVHATMGTGAYPRTHGLPEIVGRLPDGSIDELFFNRGDPSLLESETLADRWDRSRDNRPWVGILGFETWHLGMMGQGTVGRDGDRDVAVLWDRDEHVFWVNEEFYQLPTYLPPPEVLDERIRSLDRTDGAIDGTWRGHDLGDPQIVPGTPAFVEYQAGALMEMLRREPIGTDRLTDLLFLELKSTDLGGHIWNMDAPEEAEVLRAQDEVVGRLIEALERRVGRGGYIVAVTADHGQTPNPAGTGGLRIDRDEVGRDVNRYFGVDIVESASPDDLYLRMDVLAEEGITLEDVARFLGDYRYRDGAAPGTNLAGVPRDVLDRRVFAAALPGPFVRALTDADIDALGRGRYTEGVLTAPTSIESLPAR